MEQKGQKRDVSFLSFLSFLSLSWFYTRTAGLIRQARTAVRACNQAGPYGLKIRRPCGPAIRRGCSNRCTARPCGTTGRGGGGTTGRERKKREGPCGKKKRSESREKERERKIKKEGLAEACPISITCLYYCYCISLSFFLFSAFSCVLPILSLATLSFSLLSFSIVDSFFVSLLSFPGFILFFTLV